MLQSRTRNDLAEDGGLQETWNGSDLVLVADAHLEHLGHGIRYHADVARESSLSSPLGNDCVFGELQL